MQTLQSYRGFLITEQQVVKGESKPKPFKPTDGSNPLPGSSENLKTLDTHIKTGMKNKPATIKLNLSLPNQEEADYILSITGVGYSTSDGIPCIYFPMKFLKRADGVELSDEIKSAQPAIVVIIGDKSFSTEDWSKNKKLFEFNLRDKEKESYKQYPGDKACEGLFKLMLEKKIFEDIGKGGEKEGETKGGKPSGKLALLPITQEIVNKYNIEPENVKWSKSEGKQICTLRLTTERGLLKNAEGDILILLSEKPSVLKVSLSGTVKPCSIIFRRRYNNEGLFKKVFGERFVDEKFKSNEVFPMSDKQSKKADQIIASAGVDSLIWKTVQGKKVFNLQLPFGMEDSEPKMGYTVVSMDDLDLSQIEKIIKVLDKN